MNIKMKPKIKKQEANLLHTLLSYPPTPTPHTTQVLSLLNDGIPCANEKMHWLKLLICLKKCKNWQSEEMYEKYNW